MTRKNIRKGLFIIMLALACTTSYAQHRHYNHMVHHNVCRHIERTVVIRPAVTMHVSNRLNKKDRLEMALAYLKCNKPLSVSQYSKMTGLTKAMAEAELDAFAANKNNPIRMVMDGKKKRYVV